MNIWELLSEVFLFVAASYFIFYRNYVKQLGVKVAELSIIKDLTEKVESVKEKFNQDLETFRGNIQKDIGHEIEPIKAMLNRDNIGFQIYTTEYARLKFKRLDDLFGCLYLLQKFVKDNLFDYVDDEDFEKKRIHFFKIYDNTYDKMKLASLYIDDVALNSIITLLDECHNAFIAFIQFKNSQQPFFRGYATDKTLIEALINRQEYSLQRLEAVNNKFPLILEGIKLEFKRNLTYNSYQ